MKALLQIGFLNLKIMIIHIIQLIGQNKFLKTSAIIDLLKNILVQWFCSPVCYPWGYKTTEPLRCKGSEKNLWSRQESNLCLMFRKHLFYPLNYGTNWFIQPNRHWIRSAKVTNNPIVSNIPWFRRPFSFLPNKFLLNNAPAFMFIILLPLSLPS